MKKLEFNMIFEAIKKLVIMNGIFWVLMSVYRLFFFLYYANFMELKGLYAYVLKAFILGLRYDLSVIAYINALVTLTLLLVLASRSINAFKVWKNCLKIYYSIFYCLLLLVTIVDFGFYMYFKNHINILIFGVFEDDTKALISTIYQSYPVVRVGIGLIVVLILLNYFIRHWVELIWQEPEAHFNNVTSRHGGIPKRQYSPVFKMIFVFFLLAGNFMAVRGSFGLFPLGVMDAALSPNEFINKLSLTGVHTLQETLEFRMKEAKEYDLIKETGYENNIEQAFADFLEVDKSKLDTDLKKNLIKTTKRNPIVENLKPNVIVITCEGFGADLARYNSESFNVLGELGTHFDKDCLFMNFLSGDIGTIGSLETILYNVPKRPQAKAISQSKYAYRPPQTGAALPYKNAGYDTIFLYGGNSNWRNLQSTLGYIGFDKIEGEGAMDPGYQRNQWGVYDEFLFEHIYKKLEQNDGKPKFICVMTTSNHPPYSLPSGYKVLPLNIPDALDKRITGNRGLAMQRFQTYQYSNQKLGEFITRVKNSQFGKNTIIAVTGDHNFWDVFDYTTRDSLDHFGVPFYIYIPDSLKPDKVDLAAAGCHTDIMATLYNLSLSNAQYMSIGRDMLDPNINHVGFNVANLVISKDGALIYSFTNNPACFTWEALDKRKLNVSGEQPFHKSILKHYKAALAVTEYIIKKP